MRKWLGIGVLGGLVVAAAGVGAYRFFTTTTAARPEPSVEVAQVEDDPTDGDAETSDVVEPLIVGQTHVWAVPKETDEPAPRTDLPVAERVSMRPDSQQPPRPDAESGDVAPMPYADEEQGIGTWFFLDWHALKAMVRNIFVRIEKAVAAKEPEAEETNPPPEPVLYGP